VVLRTSFVINTKFVEAIMQKLQLKTHFLWKMETKNNISVSCNNPNRESQLNQSLIEKSKNSLLYCLQYEANFFNLTAYNTIFFILS